jgi:Uncharacterized protein conserved in bacteria
MAALPYLQLYPADYLADTAHLNAAQHGAYLLLIMNYWQTGAPLKDSNVRLANVARMSKDEWIETRELLEEFFEIRDGEWIHHRIERDLSEVYAKSKNASTAGKASAEARRIKRLTTVPTNVQRNVNHTDTDTDTDKDQKPLSLEEPNDGIKKSKITYSEIQKAYNETCGHVLAKCIAMTEKRKTKVRAMGALDLGGTKPFRDMGIEFWIAYFNDALLNPWNTGSNERGWRADFDYLTNPNNALKILEKTNGA